MPTTAEDIQAMVTHWLGSPPNAYLGSSYGANLDGLVQSAMSTAAADAVIAKLRDDIPVLAQLPPDQVELLGEQVGPDQIRLAIGVAGSVVLVNPGETGVPQA